MGSCDPLDGSIKGLTMTTTTGRMWTPLRDSYMSILRSLRWSPGMEMLMAAELDHLMELRLMFLSGSEDADNYKLFFNWGTNN